MACIHISNYNSVLWEFTHKTTSTNSHTKVSRHGDQAQGNGAHLIYLLPLHTHTHTHTHRPRLSKYSRYQVSGITSWWQG